MSPHGVTEPQWVKTQQIKRNQCVSMGFLPDTWKCGLRMRRECRERFPRHRLQRKPLISDPGMHHGTCVTHVPWCMSGSPTYDGGGKRSRHSRHMRNPQFYVSGKRPMAHVNPNPLLTKTAVYWFCIDHSLPSRVCDFMTGIISNAKGQHQLLTWYERVSH